MNDMPEELFANSTLPSKSTGTWGLNQLEGDTGYTLTSLTDRRELVDELISSANLILKLEPFVNQYPLFARAIREEVKSIQEARGQ